MKPKPDPYFRAVMYGVITYYRNRIRFYVRLGRLDLARQVSATCREEYKSALWEIKEGNA